MIEKNETKGYINSIIDSSIVDGEGNRIAIFMQGCNFDCLYCHNPETIPMKDANIIYTPVQLFEHVYKYFDFVDGITISGGEALLQQDFLVEFIKLVREVSNIHIIIDCNGSVEICDYLIYNVNGFALDVKVVDNTEHKRLTKCSNDIVLFNLEKLFKLNKLYEVRTVIYPGFDHSQTIEYVKNIIGNDVNYKQIKYHSKGVRVENLNKLKEKI